MSFRVPSPQLQLVAATSPVSATDQLQLVATGGSDRDWEKLKGRIHNKAAQAALRFAQQHAKGGRLGPLWRNYLRNPHVRLSAALKVLGPNATRDEAYALRDKINFKTMKYAPVTWREEPKRSGGNRIICDLPPELKALHYMLKRALERMFERRDNLFGLRTFNRFTWTKESFGRDALALRVKELQNEGFLGLAALDVVNCFPSVNLDGLYEMSWLPKEVIEHAIDTRNLWFRHVREHTVVRGRDIAGTIGDADKITGPTGLMQGSPLSPVLLATLLCPVPTTQNAQVFLCHDNLLIVGKTPEDTRSMVDTLVVHFDRCPAGPLILCNPTYADEVPIEFLGYLFDPGRPGISISGGGLERVMKRLNKVEAAVEQFLVRAFDKGYRMNTAAAAEQSAVALRWEIPRLVWSVLLDFRAGYPAVQADAPELGVLLENSRWLAERTNSDLSAFIHDNLFAENDPELVRYIRELVNGEEGFAPQISDGGKK